MIFVLMPTSLTLAQRQGRTPTRATRSLPASKAPQPSAATSQKATTPQKAATPHPTAAPEKVEAAVNQRINTLQQMLARESKNLELQLANLQQKRQVALDKGDNQTLRSIEQLEGKIVKNYEQRVASLVASLSAPPNPKSVGQPHPARHPQSQQAKGNKPAPSKNAPAPKKRFRLWPF
jgi:hypothetical protein